jgi:hypothetical protein
MNPERYPMIAMTLNFTVGLTLPILTKYDFSLDWPALVNTSFIVDLILMQ